MMHEHWEEVAHDKAEVPLDPDWDQYLALEAQGQFRVRTYRVDGALAGYLWCFVKPHLHYKSTLHAFTDIYYVDPLWRGYGGYLMFKKWLREMQALGVRKVYIADKLHMRGGKASIPGLFSRLGFREVEVVHTILL